MTNSQKSKFLEYLNRHIAFVFLLLFLLSGFTGLIYESIWSHYLKLLFGHAAYAQTLVLSIFMGGLAIGAYIASIKESKIKNHLLLYAIVEALIGLFALFFHDIFSLIQNLLFNQLAPSINSTWMFTSIKWSFGILLILPQSILLGTTFPLISSGLIKLSPDKTGKNLSLLYFNNSFGASIGALVSGFFLIQAFGLPGTILTAGIINIGIALAAFILIKYTPTNIPTIKPDTQPVLLDRFYFLMLGTAFFTGLASFFYEIAWIRMLSLVLGSTTHAFELMISAFILGLALGSLWIKKRIDQFKSPIMVLGYIQLLMASFAMLTLSFYDSLFDIVEYIFKILNRNEQGYGIYLFASHGLALLLMLPATFFAGMTLPLTTNILYLRNKNKKVIGHIYSINTLGAIIGIVLAMNFLLPLTGTKGLVSLGGLVDFSVGLTLLGYLYYKNTNNRLRIQFISACVLSLVIFQGIFQSSTFSPLKMSSGVFRSGIAEQEKDTKILFHRDGKLSTVHVFETRKGGITISNNGKPDASVNLYSTTPSSDEVTMILAGALPLAINPQIKTAANIGIGSGQTAQTLLSYKNITQVDNIEIEKGVVEALPAFKIYSQLTRYDSRSKIIIDDAKSYFASSKTKYDLIVSEPPNPWVSGVASLFTKEFYSQIKQNLSEQGILTQWVQLYEINLKTVASAIKAVSENFKNYVLYNTDNGNILIVASDNYNLEKTSDDFLNSITANKLLNRIQINSPDALHARYIGNKELLDPLFKSFKTKAASDYYPEMTYQAGKSLFLRESSSSLIHLNNYPIPINQILMNKKQSKTFELLNEKYFLKAKKINLAESVIEKFQSNKIISNHTHTNKLRYSLNFLYNQLHQCANRKLDANLFIDSAYNLVLATTPYLGKKDIGKLWKLIEAAPCYNKLPGMAKTWLQLHKEIALQNFARSLYLSTYILKQPTLRVAKNIKTYLYASAIISAIKTGQANLANSLWQSYSQWNSLSSTEMPLSLRLLQAHLPVIKKVGSR